MPGVELCEEYALMDTEDEEIVGEWQSRSLWDKLERYGELYIERRDATEEGCS